MYLGNQFRFCCISVQWIAIHDKRWNQHEEIFVIIRTRSNKKFNNKPHNIRINILISMFISFKDHTPIYILHSLFFLHFEYSLVFSFRCFSFLSSVHFDRMIFPFLEHVRHIIFARKRSGKFSAAPSAMYYFS